MIKIGLKKKKGRVRYLPDTTVNISIAYRLIINMLSINTVTFISFRSRLYFYS